MTGVAQHWFYMLERDAGNINSISWPMFKSLCQQRFGPPLGTNHLADLARLPFRGSISDYQEMFQTRLAHAGPLSAAQQVHTDVELLAPEDLQRAMALARAFERRSSALPPATFSRASRLPPRPTATSATTTAVTAPAPTSGSVTPSNPPRPLRRLTPAEMAERR